MKKYESMILFNSKESEESIRKIVSKVEEIIAKGGKVITSSNMGLKKLAYEIKNNTHAYYYLLEFKASRETVSEMERFYRIKDEIIKYIIIRIHD